MPATFSSKQLAAFTSVVPALDPAQTPNALLWHPLELQERLTLGHVAVTDDPLVERRHVIVFPTSSVDLPSTAKTWPSSGLATPHPGAARVGFLELACDNERNSSSCIQATERRGTRRAASRRPEGRHAHLP